MKPKIRTCLILLSFIVFLGGCVVPQDEEMGANADRTQGFSGYGTDNVRGMEGPLSDMMVPDQDPKGLTSNVQSIAGENQYMTGERQIDIRKDRGQQHSSQILSNRPGTLHDKQTLRDPGLENQTQQSDTQEQLSKNEKVSLMSQRILAIRSVQDVDIISDDDLYMIGVESNESRRSKLESEVFDAIRDIVNPDQVYVATDRKTVNRIRALRNGFESGQPLEELGATSSEFIRNLNRTFEQNQK
ncbi:YhcN/YlaJ family sporulation lipoprotein [Desertibacillus haloalkaliphilus]|uniref:YhcN/YlaJ family sporulation lipoprotein n=1 Tax=Desertibacillus haloalkaliphilus TaxID=1328930 RepID=UPI001C26D5C2|nr:YhcN/YlaJ family sporulation lipoprotein [Desertibacillus haloalkaliphilus]MBU8907352.1 YhcN/YlaJ family sporulation lipoprotein [Desertibacillus haloalkaliphilus]